MPSHFEVLGVRASTWEFAGAGGVGEWRVEGHNSAHDTNQLQKHSSWKYLQRKYIEVSLTLDMTKIIPFWRIKGNPSCKRKQKCHLKEAIKALTDSTAKQTPPEDISYFSFLWGIIDQTSFFLFKEEGGSPFLVSSKYTIKATSSLFHNCIPCRVPNFLNVNRNEFRVLGLKLVW